MIRSNVIMYTDKKKAWLTGKNRGQGVGWGGAGRNDIRVTDVMAGRPRVRPTSQPQLGTTLEVRKDYGSVQKGLAHPGNKHPEQPRVVVGLTWVGVWREEGTPPPTPNPIVVHSYFWKLRFRCQVRRFTRASRLTRRKRPILLPQWKGAKHYRVGCPPPPAPFVIAFYWKKTCNQRKTRHI